MKCLNCGTENQEGSKFCLNCGNSLEQPVQQQPIEQPVQQQPVQQPMYQQPVQQPMYQQPVYQQQPKKSKKGLIIGLSVGGGVLLLVIVVLVLFFVVLKGAKKGLDNLDIQLGDGVTIVTDEDKEEIKNESSKYEIGDPVTLVDGSKWHVLEYDGKDKVTLILDKLVVEETGYGKSASADDQKYENSIVKDYLVNTYKPELEKSLKSNGGATNDLVVRTLSAEEFLKYTGENWGTKCYHTILSDTSTFYYIENGKFKEYYTYEGADKLTSADKFVATLALTENFWTMSSISERTSSECTTDEMYQGAYFIKINIFDGTYGDYMSSEVGLYNDSEAAYTSSGSNFTGKGTSAGIRPVIETSIKNIK